MKKIVELKNGIETIQYEFTEKELQLLSKPIPDSPCKSCRDAEVCCGCQEYEKYKTILTEYEDCGVYPFAFDMSSMRDIQKQIQTLQEQYEKLRNGLPEQLLNIVEEKNSQEDDYTAEFCVSGSYGTYICAADTIEELTKTLVDMGFNFHSDEEKRIADWAKTTDGKYHGTNITIRRGELKMTEYTSF